MTMKDRDRILLECIGKLAVINYPYPEAARSDDKQHARFLLALGEIAGIVARALSQATKGQADE